MSGYHANIEEETLKNDFFRKVLFTGPKSQLVLMALQPGEDIQKTDKPEVVPLESCLFHDTISI